MVEKLELTMSFDKEGFMKHFESWCDPTESEGSLEDQLSEFFSSYFEAYVEYGLNNNNKRGDGNEQVRSV
jgi:hypothetical protein